MARRRRRAGKCGVLVFLAVASLACGATLDWGPAGEGGSGTWDAAQPSWFDGIHAVTWAPGSLARFGGTGGVVTVADDISVAGLQFAVGGYALTSTSVFASLEPSAAEFAIDAQADARVSAEVTAIGTPGKTWVKTGPGTLTVDAEVDFFDGLRVDEGVLVLEGGFGAFTADSVSERSTSVIESCRLCLVPATNSTSGRK